MDFSKLTAYLDSLEGAYEVHGLDCKIMRGHETLYRHMAGQSDPAGRTPITTQSLFDSYSCTKLITMTAVMQLVETGKIGLDDELQQYLPEFERMQVAVDFRIGEWPFAWPTLASLLVRAERPILIHQLMSMTAGLSYDVFSESIQQVKRETDNRATTREIVRAIARMPLVAQPGARFSYGLGHDVLAAVVEVVSGMSFGAYLRQNLFEPLGIAEMFFQVPEQEKHRLVKQYRRDFNTGEIAPCSDMIFRLSAGSESGGAGLTCTVDSYSMVLSALANGGVGANGARILQQESIDLLRENRLNGQQMQDFSRAGKVGYGYGLGVRTLVDGRHAKSPIGEFGWDGAAGAYALVDPVNQISIFYAQQVIGLFKVYSEIHPSIRDLAYEAMEITGNGANE